MAKRKKDSPEDDGLPSNYAMNFMALNEDCILEILSYLNIDDLRNAANVCTDLRDFALLVFSSKKNGERELTLIHDNDEWKKMRSHLRAFGAHMKSARLVSTRKKHRCSCRDPGLECMTFLSLYTQNLEYLEIDFYAHVLSKTILLSIANFPNLKTIKVYSLYNAAVKYSIDILKQLTLVTELVWGYPAIFDVNDLHKMIEHGVELQQLIVVCHSGVYAVDHNFLDEKLYRKMVDLISKRPNKKPLHVIIMGCLGHLSRFQMKFPAHELLKITCLEKKTVAAILNIDIVGSVHDIKMTTKVMKKLRDRALIT